MVGARSFAALGTMFVALMVVCGFSSETSNSGAKVVRKVPLGGEGRWDYLLVDPDASRLYIARATRFIVVDTKTDQLIGEIADTPGAHGVAIAPELGVGFTSNGQENKVSVFELKTLAVTKKIDTGKNPDAILYHPQTKSVFVFNGQSHSATVIDATTQTPIATIPLVGKPEFAVSDDLGNVFVNIADKNTITVIDAEKKAVRATWPLTGCDEPTGLAIDRVAEMAFASCGNKKLVVVDAKAGRVKQTIPIGDDCDAVAFDPNTKMVFASNGEGNLTIIARDASGKYRVAQTLTTQPGSKTMGLDATSHHIYLPAARFDGPPTQKPRPKVVPGSFEVWVISEPGNPDRP